MAKFKLPDPSTYMTPEQLAFGEAVAAARADIRTAELNLSAVLKTCKHVFVPLSDEMKDMLRKHDVKSWGKFDNARCDSCGKGFGWRCPDSPDSVCHYYSSAGFVKLVDGTSVPVPGDDHDPDYETDDNCLFCHAPDERK